MQQPKESILKSHYNNERFPDFFKRKFKFEQESIYNQFLNDFLNCLQTKNFDEYIFYLSPVLEKIIKVYGLTLEKKEFLVTIHFEIVFQEQNLTIFQRNTFASNLLLLLSKKKFKNLEIYWKKIYLFLKKNYFSNEKSFELYNAPDYSKLLNNICRIVQRTKR